MQAFLQAGVHPGQVSQTDHLNQPWQDPVTVQPHLAPKTGQQLLLQPLHLLLNGILHVQQANGVAVDSNLIG